MFSSVFPIAAGAVFGALSRWLLGLLLSSAALPFACGMLAANWIGALLIGLVAECVQNPQWRLLLITGFLGSLTTFSSFSLEIVGLMQAQRWGAAAAAAVLHIGGSLLLTALGIWLAQMWK